MEELIHEREFSREERDRLARSGAAMPDGSFPIETVADLRAAIGLWAHSSHPKEAKRHIIRRAKALGALQELPRSWHPKGESWAEESASSETDPDMAGAGRIRETAPAEPTVISAGRGPSGRHVLEVTLIAPGTSRNGNHYPSSTIRSGARLFEGARAFADHHRPDDLPERSVRDLVGSYRNVRVDESGKLRGELHLVPGNDWLFNLLREAENNPNLCGLSIDAWCDQDPVSRTVKAFRKVESVDIVTRPSAGGQVNRIIQSDRTAGAAATTIHTKEISTVGNQDSTSIQTAETGSGMNAPTEASMTALLESLQADRASQQSRLDELTAALARQQEQLAQERALATSQITLATKLAESALPEPVVAKLRKQFSSRVFEAATLDSAIEDERATLAALTSAGQITGLGYEKAVSVGFSEFDQIQAAFDKLFDVHESEAGRSVPAFAGIREAFRVCTGYDICNTGGADRVLTPALREALRQKVASGRLSESEILLKEADVTTASFSYLLGTSMNIHPPGLWPLSEVSGRFQA